VNTVLCDMHDVAADRAEGIPTIPVRLGFDGSLLILHGVNVLAATAVVVATWFGVLPVFLLVLVAHDVLVLCLLVRTQRRGVAPSKGLIDGSLLLLGPLASLAGSIARS
jgi:4-hydroxybenzoate polyprenyltransferase